MIPVAVGELLVRCGGGAPIARPKARDGFPEGTGQPRRPFWKGLWRAFDSWADGQSTSSEVSLAATDALI
jgi:hypothetical protein